jgi:hypothetical protein
VRGDQTTKRVHRNCTQSRDEGRRPRRK